MTSALRILSVLMALAIAAISCSSSNNNGSSVTKAKALAYTDPTSTADWRLVRDSSSTDTHLVLNLVGPAGSSAKGAGVTLLADATKAKWSIGADGQAVQNVAFNLGSGTQLVRGMVSGDALLAGVFQKGGNAVATASPVIRVALDLNTQASIASGTAIPISVAPNSAKIITASGAAADINVAVGQLRAN